MITASRVIHINSANRTSGSNESFTTTFSLGSDESYTHCCVLQASIPNSYYLVQENFNVFNLEEKGVAIPITVPPGNYNSRSFITIVKNLLNAYSPNLFVYDININNSYSFRVNSTNSFLTKTS